MNSFAHALPYLDDPYMAVACCLPDWLAAIDRKCRVREKNALRFVDASDPIVATTAAGIVQHHRDDDWFHRTPIFNELMLNFSVELRGLFGNERTMRPGFVGHVVVELFLDAYLHEKFPGALEAYYDLVATADADRVQSAVNLFATHPSEKIVPGIGRFLGERYLFDYETDGGIVFRINRVISRIKLEPLDERMLQWMPQARQRVYENAAGLLANYPLRVD